MFNKSIYTILFGLCIFLVPQITKGQNKVLTAKWEVVQGIGKPMARHENSFVCLKNKFYLIGGRGIKPISIYNTKTGRWSQGAKPPMEIHHFQAVPYKGNIYIFGAMTGKYPYETPLSNILIYNPKNNLWSKGANIPKARRRGSVGVVIKKNKAYLVSGIVDGHNGTHVPWLDSYNFKTKKWTMLPDAPRARDHFHAVVIKNKIYAVGGRNSSYATKQTFNLTIPEIDVYNLKTNTWVTLPKQNNLAIPRAGSSTVVLGDNLILIGGESALQKKAHNEVNAFNITKKSWIKMSNLNTGRHGTQALVFKKCIYTTAGSGNRGGKPELNTMERLCKPEIKIKL